MTGINHFSVEMIILIFNANKIIIIIIAIFEYTINKQFQMWIYADIPSEPVRTHGTARGQKFVLKAINTITIKNRNKLLCCIK